MSDVFLKYDGENSDTQAVDYLQSQVSIMPSLGEQGLTRIETEILNVRLLPVNRPTSWRKLPLSR